MKEGSLRFIELWIDSVYDIENHWDRLRVIGTAENLDDGIAQISFYPIKQRIPAFSVKTRPEMADASTAQILAEYNTLANLCEIFPGRKCNVSKENPSDLGKTLKFLLRMSNYSYPHMFAEVNEVPSALSDLGQKPSPLFQGVPILDIQALQEKILIIGGPIGKAGVWPTGYPVSEADYTKQGFAYRGFVGEDIIVPTAIVDGELGTLVAAVWKAKKSVLETHRKKVD